MNFKLYKIEGYEAAINALRMSTGEYYSWEKAQEIQLLVELVTDHMGRICSEEEYNVKAMLVKYCECNKISLVYEADIAEFKRLLTLTFNQAMKENKHHTLMKYIDITFFTNGLHRGGQDDLDAHAMGFQNRITRFSTRLAEIPRQEISEWYEDKIIPFGHVIEWQENSGFQHMPNEIEHNGEMFVKTHFGYVAKRYADMSEKSGLYKDVMRGLMNLATPSNGLWKINLFDFRHVYAMRSKIRTKANPELKDGIEMLADQIEQDLVVFGERVKHQYTSSGQWEHINKVKTITEEEYRQFEAWRESLKEVAK